MKYAVVFLVAMIAVAGMMGGIEAAPKPEWEGLGKELEGVGKRVFAAAQKFLPVAQGYVELYDKFKNKDSEENED